MATTKKATAKRTTNRAAAVKKKAPTKKSAPRKTAAKKPAAQRRSRKSASIQSFRLSQDQPPFFTFRITRQTVYWIILVAFIVFVQLWIISLQVEVAGLIETQQRLLLESSL